MLLNYAARSMNGGCFQWWMAAFFWSRACLEIRGMFCSCWERRVRQKVAITILSISSSRERNKGM
ncbi:MAG: hypothetical protein ACTSWN_10245 [Promethearchaeota archaeon]